LVVSSCCVSLYDFLWAGMRIPSFQNYSLSKVFFFFFYLEKCHKLNQMCYFVQTEYMFIGAALWVTVFCVIEMDKPDKPHNFEPEIYNMERGARDKLIADYNSMDIWDFNEKYGDLWDFTLNKDEIVKS
jgi:hypothetical protein